MMLISTMDLCLNFLLLKDGLLNVGWS
jgi:hypothetical protein